MADKLTLGIVIGASLSGTVGSAFRSLDSKIKQTSSALGKAQIGQKLAGDVIKYKQQIENLKAAQQQFGLGNTKLWGQLAQAEAGYRKAAAGAEKYGLKVGDIVREHKQLGDSAAQAERKLARLTQHKANKDVRANIQGQLLGAVGAAYAASAPIKSAIEFESVMADVRKVVDMTDAEFKQLGKSILDLSAKTPMAASGIGAIVAAAGQSGVAKNELLNFAMAASKMGVAFDMSGEEAGQTMASWRAGMAITQQQAESLADAINYLDSNMNASAKNISDVVRRQGAVAKAAGLNEIQIAALSAALLNSGAESEIAATALKNMTNALTKGESATKAQQAVFEQLGLTSKQVTASMQKDAEGTIKQVFAALAKAPAENRGALVGDLFGEEAKGAIMPLLVNMQAMEQAFNSVGKATQYAGSMQKEYDVRSQTTANNLQLLQNQTSRLGVNIGSLLLPALNSVVGVIGGVVNGVTGLAERFPTLTTVIVGAAVGLVGLKVAALATGYAATLISDGWLIAKGVMDFFRLSTLQTNAALVWNKTITLGMAIGQKALAAGTAVVTAAQWLWNAALSANPIGLVIAGVTAFGALAYTVYKNWEPIMKWFQDKFAWLGKSVDWVKGLGGSLFGGGKGAAIGAALGAATVGLPANATPLPNLPAAGKGAQITQTTHAPINIYQQPGQNNKDLAKQVSDELRRTQAADQRRALHD